MTTSISAGYTWQPHIIAHAGLAAFCFFLGLYLLLNRKGTKSHRILGWTWVLCMLSVAVISFWIHRNGQFSWIHGLSVFTPIMLTVGVYAARRHDVQRHRRTMIGIYVGALLIAGAFTFLPSRLIGHWVWSQLGWL